MNKTQRQLWSEVCDLLSFKQFCETMGGDMLYKSKALKAMRLSKSKAVHALCQQIIALADTANKVA